jgi:hypothetical protein
MAQRRVENELLFVRTVDDAIDAYGERLPF